MQRRSLGLIFGSQDIPRQKHARHSVSIAGLFMSSRKLVVVVDDDKTMLRSLERLLNASGFDTEVFPSAEAFLARTCARDAACLVLDIHLGGMSGIELRRRVAASGSAVPVVFMTAFDDENTHEEAVQAGCVACLHKPFPARLLIGAIKTVAQ
jgi:FixJ family two-component response regulator